MQSDPTKKDTRKHRLQSCLALTHSARLKTVLTIASTEYPSSLSSDFFRSFPLFRQSSPKLQDVRHRSAQKRQSSGSTSSAASTAQSLVSPPRQQTSAAPPLKRAKKSEVTLDSAPEALVGLPLRKVRPPVETNYKHVRLRDGVFGDRRKTVGGLRSFQAIYNVGRELLLLNGRWLVNEIG